MPVYANNVVITSAIGVSIYTRMPRRISVSSVKQTDNYSAPSSPSLCVTSDVWVPNCDATPFIPKLYHSSDYSTPSTSSSPLYISDHEYSTTSSAWVPNGNATPFVPKMSSDLHDLPAITANDQADISVGPSWHSTFKTSNIWVPNANATPFVSNNCESLNDSTLDELSGSSIKSLSSDDFVVTSSTWEPNINASPYVPKNDKSSNGSTTPTPLSSALDTPVQQPNRASNIWVPNSNATPFVPCSGAGMRNPPGEINSGDIPGDFPGDMRGISPGTNFWVFLVLNVTVSYY
uniref:Ovule protein n=1 Tax=Panagrellus redivivus TaxID=6233 RepID=A0A7E4VS75_PANRE